MRGLRVAAVFAALMLVASACGDDDGGITIEGEWARTSPAAVTNGAAYLQLTAAEDDALIGVSVDSSIAGMAQIHEVVMDTDGAMQMQQVASIPLPAGETVSLEPGGFHVMIMNLAAPFESGQKFDVTLQFEVMGEVVVEVEVMEEAP
ncbi:MAG: copper chaperone PCu(A)C [Acidimicrobiia bacterium]